MATSLSTALQTLASFRLQSSRSSQQVFEKGISLVENDNNLWRHLDDDAWVEQMALASIDVGRLDVADRCISALSSQFPGSPRVECLVGIRKEATEPPDVVLRYYEDLLDEDESNAAAWKRLVSVLRRMGKYGQAIDELSRFLDTYYADVEGWLELADMYSSCNQYEHALKSLQHALLLAPQNPFYVLQAAETAYTLGDVPLAVKMFLMVVDMTDADDTDSPADSVPEGITVRAWYGVKQCTRRLLKDPRNAAQSQSQTSVPEHVKLIDELATERLLTSYSSGSGPVNGREVLVRWLETSQ